MFDDLDETLRNLLVEELPIRTNEIEIAFEQPRRDWSARLNRPTVNLFLHDLRENIDLRHSYQHQGKPTRNGDKVSIPRPSHRFDVHYLITAWASDPDDEHRLLARTLLALLRVPELSRERLHGSLRNQPVPLQVRVSQYESHLKPLDIWGVLDNEMRPALMCQVTLSIEPHEPMLVPAVRTRELRMGDLQGLSSRSETDSGPVRFLGKPRNIANEQGRTREPTLGEGKREFWTIGGRIEGAVDAKQVNVLLIESGIDVPVAADGRFVIGNLRTGVHTLRVEIDGVEREHQLEVPGDTYEISDE